MIEELRQIDAESLYTNL